MKKILLLMIILFATGCSVVRIDTTSIDNITSVILSKDNNLFNRIGKGYKYYVPRGVAYIDTNELNDKLYSDGVYYYLYIDAISYYNKIVSEYEIDSKAYYSKEISYNGKKGYLEINKVDDKYYIEFLYNYAKIEAIADKSEINDVILNSSYILSTIKFNDNIIKLMLDSDFFTNRDEVYDIFNSKKETDRFLKFDNEGN